MSSQKIYRKGSFDSGHRVMNEKFKCFNIHGHTYKYLLVFDFSSMEEIGYAIDFKEIKRLGCQWIDDMLDHAFIANPKDTVMLDASEKLFSKHWNMSLANGEYCNPTVENIAKEIFLAMNIIFESFKGLKIYEVQINETENCGTTCSEKSIVPEEWRNFELRRADEIRKYVQSKGILNYDDRK